MCSLLKLVPRENHSFPESRSVTHVSPSTWRPLILTEGTEPGRRWNTFWVLAFWNSKLKSGGKHHTSNCLNNILSSLIWLAKKKKTVRHDYLQKQKQKHIQQEIHLFYTYLLFGHSKQKHMYYHHISMYAAAAAASLQSCPTLCDPIDGSPPGSPIPGILQTRTLEWVAISFSSAGKWKVKVKSLSHVWLFVTPWTAAHQAPLPMGFSRQEYWSGEPSPSPTSMYIHIKKQDR